MLKSNSVSTEAPSTQREAGNAVTLTLLGLAVAILAGVFVLYWIGRDVAPPVPIEQQYTTESFVEEEQPDPRAGWHTYTNDDYNFSFQYPPGWIVATGTVLGVPNYVVYDARLAPIGTTTISLHDIETQVAVYPLGMPSALVPADRAVDSTVVVQVPQASAKDLLLDSRRPWATLVSFERVPEVWSTDGVVFARVRIDEESRTYLRNGEVVSEETYGTSPDDEIVRTGFSDPAIRTIQEEILRSFRFSVQTDGAPAAGSEEDRSAADAQLRVRAPVSGTVVHSPLEVRGEVLAGLDADSLDIVLRDSAEDVLGQTVAPFVAGQDNLQGVPFAVTFAFASTTATTGSLIVQASTGDGQEPELFEVIPVRFVSDIAY